MQLDECLKIIGHGSSAIGLTIVERLAFYLMVARHKHPIERRTLKNASAAVAGETQELIDSVAEDLKLDENLSAHSIDEAYDVLVTTVRLINSEYE